MTAPQDAAKNTLSNNRHGVPDWDAVATFLAAPPPGHVARVELEPLEHTAALHIPGADKREAATEFALQHRGDTGDHAGAMVVLRAVRPDASDTVLMTWIGTLLGAAGEVATARDRGRRAHAEWCEERFAELLHDFVTGCVPS